jgi:uncharacterized membrane-anchored protein
MSKQKILILIFVLTAFAQIFVPAKMVFDSEQNIRQGNEFLFRLRPVDPNDPFKGKYIMLYFEQNSFPVSDIEKKKSGASVYVLLTNDSEGYAQILSVQETPPIGEQDFIEANIAYINSYDSLLIIDYPFNKYYMEESKAALAEDIYREIRDKKTAYASVFVKNGKATLAGVYIDGVSIEQLAKERQEELKSSQ